jgi:predicted lipid-binding transport protein (Tim44 family)
MNNLDILIYAAIAAFLLFRLWSVLGQKTEDETKDNPRPNPFERTPEKDTDEENVVVLEGRARPAQPSALTGAGHAPASLAGTIDQMKQVDPAFNEKQFMEGAKAAFRQIVECFASGDLTKVVWLLGPNVRLPFEKIIAQRQAAGEKLLNKIDRIDAADIIGAKLVDNVATLVVEYVSHQSHIVLAAGESEYGKTWPRPEETRDVWTFRRDLKSADPNWLLVETHA